MDADKIIELAKKAANSFETHQTEGTTYDFTEDTVEHFAALHRQALIDCGELVPGEKVEKEREFSKQLWYLLHGDTQHFEVAIDRARSQP